MVVVGRLSRIETYKLNGKRTLIRELLKAGALKRKMAAICRVDRNMLARFIARVQLEDK